MAPTHEAITPEQKQPDYDSLCEKLAEISTSMQSTCDELNNLAEHIQWAADCTTDITSDASKIRLLRAICVRTIARINKISSTQRTAAENI